MTTAYRTSAYITLLLGSTSMASASGGAAPDLTGSFTAGGGILGYESTDEPTDTNDLVINGSASVGVRLAPNWSVQFDVLGEQVAAGHDNPDQQYISAQAVGGHLTWRKPGTGSVGIFTGFGNGTNTQDDVGFGGWIGVEGQLFFNEFTFYGQAAIIDGLDESAYLIRGVGRYFINDNFKVEVELARVDGDLVFGGKNGEGTEWGILVQKRMADGPLYGTLAFRSGEYELQLEDQADIQMFTVGLTFMFGTDSLKANDREGVSLDTSLMPMRATAAFDEMW